MGEAWHICRKRVDTEGVIVRSSNYTLYGDMSARVMRALSRFTPELEIYSIDEAFLGLAGFETRLAEHARELRRTVLRWTGIPVSVGIAPTKTLAKVANRRAKKDPACEGVCILADETAIDAQLAGMELTDFWGVAGRLAARLRAIGIADPLALKRADPRFIRERFNVVLERLVLELRGMPCIALEEVTPDRKSIMASRSFGRTVETRQELEEAVATFTRARGREDAPPGARRHPADGVRCTPTASAPMTRSITRPSRSRFPWRLPTPAGLSARRCARSPPSTGRASATRRPASCSSSSSRPPRRRAACSTPPTVPPRRRGCAPSTRSTGATAATR